MSRTKTSADFPEYLNLIVETNHSANENLSLVIFLLETFDKHPVFYGIHFISFLDLVTVIITSLALLEVMLFLVLFLVIIVWSLCCGKKPLIFSGMLVYNKKEIAVRKDVNHCG